jgi:hypothetical protein
VAAAAPSTAVLEEFELALNKSRRLAVSFEKVTAAGK